MKIIIFALICIVAFAIFRFSKKKSEKEPVSKQTPATTPEDETETKSENNIPMI